MTDWRYFEFCRGSAFRFFGRRRIGAMADHRHHGEGEHHQGNVAMPPMPGSALVVIEPELVFGGLKAVLDRPRWPSTATSVSMDVPAGHHVVKKARSPSSMRRRIRRPRVHRLSFVWLDASISRSASSR